jgi:cobalt/nickel transport system ATP-binding protein
VVLSQGRVVRQGPTAAVLGDRPFLEAHDLEPPLSYSRPYCLLEHAPKIPQLSSQQGRLPVENIQLFPDRCQ